MLETAANALASIDRPARAYNRRMNPHTPPPATDQSLLRRFRAGDDDAATRLYFKYARQLHAVARKKTDGALANRVDAEDVVQSVFRTFFRRTARGEFEVPEGEELWRLLLTIALNKVRNHAAHHRAQKRDIGKTVSEAAAVSVAEDDQSSRVLLEIVVKELLGDLDESQRQIIQLRIDGAEVAEIAHVTGRAKRSVERVLQGFRNELASKLDIA
jgi:RNA polymerase sigma-70 factor, ECF subfamily